MSPQARLAALVVLGVPAATAPAPGAMRGAVVQRNGSMSSATTPGTASCSAAWRNCLQSTCCSQGYVCYEKHQHYAQCRPTGRCNAGFSQEGDPDNLPWTCRVLPDGCADRSSGWASCIESKCCAGGFMCYEKDHTWAQCRPAGQCTPGTQPDDPIKTPWTCRHLTPTTTGGHPLPSTTALLTTAPASTTTAPASTTAPAPLPGIPCQDFQAHCHYLASMGICLWHPQLCPRTCRLCH